MPTYEMLCKTCGHEYPVYTNTQQGVEGTKACERCASHDIVRQFTPGTMVVWPDYMKRENEDGRAKHRAWLQTPEVQAKIRSGELDTASNDD